MVSDQHVLVLINHAQIPAPRGAGFFCFRSLKPVAHRASRVHAEEAPPDEMIAACKQAARDMTSIRKNALDGRAKPRDSSCPSI
jgi:hypothetical protein